MKKYSSILIALLCTLFTFSLVTYTSCKKDPCDVYVCYNNGTCQNGKCVCPTGYMGNKCEQLAPVTMILKNSAKLQEQMVISIYTQNGSNDIFKTLNAGDTASITGTNGAQANIEIDIMPVMNSGYYIGGHLSWDTTINFSPGASQMVSLDVPSSYFFLQVLNVSSYVIGYATIDQGEYTYSNLNIPNSNTPYALGYYLAESNSNVVLRASSNTWTFNNLALPFTQNQVITLTAN